MPMMMLKNTRHNLPCGDNQVPREVLRRCVTCRHLLPRGRLVRVTYDKNADRFTVNQNPVLQGRSAYVCCQADCLSTALKGKKLSRTLKRQMPDAIVKYLNEQLEGLKNSGCVKD